MADPSHGINDFYFVSGKSKEGEGEATPVTLEDEPSEQPQKDEPEIRLIKGTWISNDEELDFNKDCTAKIEAKFI